MALDKLFGIGVLLTLQNRLSPVAKKARMDLRQLEGQVDDLDKRMKRFDAFDKLANKGQRLTTTLTLPIVGAAGVAINASMKLGEAMGQVATLIPGQEERVEHLKTVVQETAIATGKSTNDLAQATYQTISLLGDQAGKTETFIAQAAKAAVAGGSSVTDAVNLIGGVLRAYNLDQSEAARVSDLLFTTVRKGATTFPELASNMGKVLSVSGSLNIGLEEIAAAFATLTGASGNTAEVSTQLSGVLQKFIQPSEALEKAFHALGFSSGKAMLASKGFAGSLSLLSQYAKVTGTNIADMFPEVEGLRAVLSLVGRNAEAFTENLKEMRNAAGATDEAFRAQTTGVGKAAFAWQQFQQRISVLSQNIGDELAPSFMAFLDALNPLVNAVIRGIKWFSNLPKPVQTTAIAAVGLVAALGPAMMIIGNFGMMAVTVGPKLVLLSKNISTAAKAGGTLTNVLKNLGIATKLLMGPVGWIIGAATLIYIAWSKNLFGFRDIVTNVFNSVAQKISGFVGWLRKIPIVRGLFDANEKISGVIPGEQQPKAQKSSPVLNNLLRDNADQELIKRAGAYGAVLDEARKTVRSWFQNGMNLGFIQGGTGGMVPALAAAGAAPGMTPAAPAIPPQYQPGGLEPTMVQNQTTTIREGDHYEIIVQTHPNMTQNEAYSIGQEVARAIRLEQERRPK